MKQQKDKTFIINVTLPKSDIDKSFQQVLKSVQADFETKGFRKGKAPLKIVQENVSETKLIEEVLTQLISKVYSEEIEKNHLHPVIQPQIKVINPPIALGKDWEIEITGCELPTIKLNDKYVTEIKKVNQSKDDENTKITAIMDALVKNSNVELPEIPLKADIENKLSQLVEQTQQAGITIQQFLKSRKQTLEQYQEILKTQVKNEWITNLAIDKISKDNNLTVSQQEVDDLVKKSPQMAKNLNLVYYLLTQQKVFNYLRKL